MALECLLYKWSMVLVCMCVYCIIVLVCVWCHWSSVFPSPVNGVPFSPADGALSLLFKVLTVHLHSPSTPLSDDLLKGGQCDHIRVEKARAL